jgi:hypothetical protein
MKRPLAAVISFYVAALLLAEIFQPPPVALFAAAFAVLALALFRQTLRLFLIGPLLALAGWTNLTVHTAVVSPDDFARGHRRCRAAQRRCTALRRVAHCNSTEGDRDRRFRISGKPARRT